MLNRRVSFGGARGADGLSCSAILAAIAMAWASVDVCSAQEAYQLPESARATTPRTYVSAVAELPGGRLVVVDMLERAVLIYGADLDSLGAVGGIGQGPREYLAPQGLIGMPDGRVLVQDIGNGRLLELNQEGTAVGVVPVPAGLPPFLAGGEVPFVDDSGRWYFRTATIPGDERDGVAYDSLTLSRSSGVAGQAIDWVATRPVRHMNGPFRMSSSDAPFSRPVSDWAVCPDGGVYVTLPEPYRVRVYPAVGDVVVGPPIEVESVPVTEAWVDRWWEEGGGASPSPVLRVSRGGASDVAYEVRERTRLDLPDQLPATTPGGTHCGPDGSAWVERHVAADQPPRVDVFDSTGTRVKRFDLPFGARIVGFGEASVYAVVRDEVDLEYLIRLDVPVG